MEKVVIRTVNISQDTRTFDYAPGYSFVRGGETDSYDWLVVFERFSSDRPFVCNCPRERTLYISWEPTSVKSYSRPFVNQFGHYLTNRPYEAERHAHYHFGEGYFPSRVGHTWAELCAPAPEKTKLIASVCTTKRMRQTMHYKRYELTSHLAATIPGFEWYGRGVCPIERKCDALDAYKYHVAVENHVASGHWTEKLADPIYAECLTFYAGDPDIGRVLPPESFIPIPIDNPKEAERIIRTAIENDEYTKRVEAIREAKRRLTVKYNLWAQIIKVIEESKDQPVSGPVPFTLYGRKTLWRHHPYAAVADGFSHFCRYLKGGR